jgi:hypothetical protein
VIFDVLYAFISTSQRFVAEATYLMEKVCHFKLASFLQLNHLCIGAVMLPFQVCGEVILPVRRPVMMI